MSNEQWARLALYVHVPFCRARCAYCDFNTYAGLDHLLADYVRAVCIEGQTVAALQAARGKLPLHSIYFGGGTPSLLPLDLFAQLFRSLCREFDLVDDGEVTVEANPGTVSLATLRGLRELGVNRLSLGVQAIHEEELRMLGRIHSWADAVAAVHDARAAGFDNLNLDLIYGLPGQSLARWQRALETVLTLSPNHLSLYALSIEEGTPLAAKIAGGELPMPDEDIAAEMVERVEEMLAVEGYVHYEISNWASDGSQCRHNLTYWRNEPYLGLGAGASSWWQGQRWTNIRHPAAYIEQLRAGASAVDESEQISLPMEMGETMMMGLRLAEGVSDARFRARFGVGLQATYGPELARLQSIGLLVWDGKVARLTPRGRLLGNQVFGCFLPD